MTPGRTIFSAEKLRKEVEEVRDQQRSAMEVVEEKRNEAVVEEHGTVDQVSKRIQPWRRQITARGMVASVLIGFLYSIIAMKLNLTTGLIPNFNISAAFLAFLSIHLWTKLLHKIGIVTVPFTCQENTMIQTTAVACYSIAAGGGFGTYLMALTRKTYEQAGVDMPGNAPGSYKEPEIGWMTAFQLLVSFIGLFVLVPLRKIFIVDYKLPFPSGMATAVLINGFHSRKEQVAKKQVRGFMKVFSFSFLWGFFQWFYSGNGMCGFSQFPTFGLQALKQTFYFDFSMTYVGTGMLCPHIVNFSALLGGVLSWGLMWPLVHKTKGEWFPATIPESSMKSLNGYKVFISIALLLGDGLYNIIKIAIVTINNFRGKLGDRNLSIAMCEENKTLQDPRQDKVFTRETIPFWVGAVGYVVFAGVSTIAVPLIFPELKWYYVIVAYVVAPAFAFCNAYGVGLTDINMSYNYSKLGLFVLAALAGKQHGVVAGLAACGLIKAVLSVSCILMQDFKTGYLTMTSPRAMLLTQAVGTAIGSVIGPLTFFLFYKAFNVGDPNGDFKAPYALVYRNMAILGVEGFSALPEHCLQLCYGFFALAVLIDLLKDVLPPRFGKYMPVPAAMAITFIIGAYFAIDMCVGSLVVFAWQKINSRKAEFMVPALASGLICGEGLWSLPSSVLALAKVTPPICMKFFANS